MIQSGRIEIGPWYVLPDEFLVSGEALVRNLLYGHQTGALYGSVMKVGYAPDSFGHVAQLPQILRGFQIDNFIFTRGLGEEETKLGTEFLWNAPDGSRVLAINQRKGYCNGNHLGYETAGEHNGETPRFDVLVDFFKQEIAELGRHAKPGSDGTCNLLINNGCDHQEPQADLPRMLTYVNNVLPEIQVEHTSFSRFVHVLRRAGLALTEWSGEIHGGKSHFILSGVLSSRVYLKRLNDACETLLTHLAEPLGVMLWHRAGQDSHHGFLNHAWKILLQNHPHDSICGCSIDQVHRDMLPRFAEVKQIGKLVTSAAMDYLASRVQHNGAPAVVVANTLAFPRTQVVRSFVLVPPSYSLKRLTLVDPVGKPIPTHVIKTRGLASRPGYALPEAFLRTASLNSAGIRPLDYENKSAQLHNDFAAYDLAPRKKERPWKLVEVEYLAQNIPALGYRAFSLRESASVAPETPLKVKGATVENQFFRVKFASDATFVLYHKATKRQYGPVNVLEDNADIGDTYDYAPAKGASILSRNRRGKMKFVHRSPLAVEIEIKTVLPLPAKFERARRRRSKKTVACQLHWRFTVTASSPFVQVELTLHNLAEDHRLRMHAATPISAASTWAGQPFHLLERPLKKSAGKDWRQPPAPTAPMQHLCAAEDRRGGLAILTHGLYEYEALKERKGVALAVTLLRSVGWLSRPDLSTRSDNAGPEYVAPEAQCLGEHKFRYAFLPYSGHAATNHLAAHAQSYRVPMLEEQCTGKVSNQPAEYSLLQCEPQALLVTAVKKSEQRNTTIVRLYNASSERVKGKVTWGAPLTHAWRVNLAEERLEEIPILAKTRLDLDVPAWRIVTIELEASRKMAG
jgi:mannosylglycerate hydrolase